MGVLLSAAEAFPGVETVVKFNVSDHSNMCHVGGGGRQSEEKRIIRIINTRNKVVGKEQITQREKKRERKNKRKNKSKSKSKKGLKLTISIRKCILPCIRLQNIRRIHKAVAHAHV